MENEQLKKELTEVRGNDFNKLQEIKELKFDLREQAKEIREWVYDNFRLRTSIEEFDEFILAFDKKFLEKTK